VITQVFAQPTLAPHLELQQINAPLDSTAGPIAPVLTHVLRTAQIPLVALRLPPQLLMLSANLRSQVTNALLNALTLRAVQLMLLLIKLAKLVVFAPLHALIMLLAQHMLVPQLAKP
jgi:hypothetical protein